MNAKELGAQPITAQLLVMGEKAMSKGGLTKREFFAALAMQGLLAHHGDYAQANEASVDYADGLLTELTKEQP